MVNKQPTVCGLLCCGKYVLPIQKDTAQKDTVLWTNTKKIKNLIYTCKLETPQSHPSSELVAFLQSVEFVKRMQTCMHKQDASPG